MNEVITNLAPRVVHPRISGEAEKTSPYLRKAGITLIATRQSAGSIKTASVRTGSCKNSSGNEKKGTCLVKSEHIKETSTHGAIPPSGTVSTLPDGWVDTGSELQAKLPQALVTINYRICNGWNPVEGDCHGVEVRITPRRNSSGMSPYIPNEVLAEALRKAGWTCTPPSR